MQQESVFKGSKFYYVMDHNPLWYARRITTAQKRNLNNEEAFFYDIDVELLHKEWLQTFIRNGFLLIAKIYCSKLLHNRNWINRQLNQQHKKLITIEKCLLN